MSMVHTKTIKNADQKGDFFITPSVPAQIRTSRSVQLQPESQSLSLFLSILVWTGGNDTKKADVDENILLRFRCVENGGF